MRRPIFILCVSIFLIYCVADRARSQTVTPSKQDAAVLAALSLPNAKVISRLDLTKPFRTKGKWAFVVVQEPEAPNPGAIPDIDPDTLPGLIHFCFVRNGHPDCSNSRFARPSWDHLRWWHWEPDHPDFRHLDTAEIWYPRKTSDTPVLVVVAAGEPGANANEYFGTFVFTYREPLDRFDKIYSNGRGTNNNEETRIVERGALAGHIIEAYPSTKGVRYFISVYRFSSVGAEKILHYRSVTGYGDGNQLAVIDAEMPEIERRLHLWKPGDPLPIPQWAPQNGPCGRVVLRNGIEWCD